MVNTDALRDCEARVRALTREVGSLREDLRRETKRRERAVAQAQQHESEHKASQSKQQELEYANRKLAAELDAAHDAGRAAAERDRRSLKQLREGLTLVEQEVTVRGRQGCELATVTQIHLQNLQGLLLQPPGITVLGTSLAQQVATGLAGALKPLHQLHALLSGSTDALQANGDAFSGTSALHNDAARGLADTVSLAAAVANDVEKQQLRDEVVRLRSQLQSVVDKAAGAASAATVELQSLLRDSQTEALSLRSEVIELQATLQRSSREMEALQGEVAALTARLHAQESGQQQSATTIEQLATQKAAAEVQVQSLRSLNNQLETSQDILKAENNNLQAEVSHLMVQLAETTAKLEALHANIAEQQEDVRAAMQLVASVQIPRPFSAHITSSHMEQTSWLKPKAQSLLGQKPVRPKSAVPQPDSVPALRLHADHSPRTWGANAKPLPTSVQVSTHTSAAAAAHHLLQSQLPHSSVSPHPHATHTVHAVPTSIRHLHGTQDIPTSAQTAPTIPHNPLLQTGKYTPKNHYITQHNSNMNAFPEVTLRPASPMAVSIPTSLKPSNTVASATLKPEHAFAVQKATGSAAAAAAAAIAARLKAQQAIAAAEAASLPSFTPQQQDSRNPVTTPAKAAAFTRLGAQLAGGSPSQQSWQHHELPSSISASITGTTSRSSIPSSNGIDHSQPGRIDGVHSLFVNQEAIAVTKEKSDAGVVGSQTFQMDQLLRNMKGLDEQIAALEASMKTTVAN